MYYNLPYFLTTFDVRTTTILNFKKENNLEIFNTHFA